MNKSLQKVLLKAGSVFLFILLIFNAQSSMAQDRIRIKGSVKDSVGALPGVGLAVAGTRIATSTDGNGNYSIEVPKTGVLIVTFVGYVTRRFEIKNMSVNAAGEHALNILLKPDDSALDEVAIIAFGTQKKSTLVGSITTINPKELKGPTSNLTQMLAGRLSGVIGFQRSGEPGADNANFYIRGLGSFGGGKTDPLILIDGMESNSNDLARLQPDDIAAFSLLKDASASAIYGSKGANGVILVTTKSGEVGATKFSFRAENSLSTNTANMNFADNITYMNLANEAVLTRKLDVDLPYSQAKIDRTASGTANPYLYPNNNWIDELIKDYTLVQRYNLNVSGGADKAQYYIAGTYNIDNGNMKVDKLNNFNSNIKLKTYGIRSNVNIKLTKSLEGIVRVAGRFDEYNGPIGGGGQAIYNSAVWANPVAFPAMYPAGYLPFVKHPLFGSAMIDGNGANGLYMNPYAKAVSGYQEYSKSNLQAQIELKQDLKMVLPGLRARLMSYTQRNSNFSLERSYQPFFYSATTTDGTDVVLNPLNDGTSASSVGPVGTEYLTYNEGDKTLNTTFYAEGAINYDHDFGKHAVSGMMITTMRHYLTGNAGSLQASLPQRNQGIAGRFTYGYDTKYLVDLNFAYNGSERFSAQNRYGFFPSIGLGWITSNEKFFKPLTSVITKLKFRGSYGRTGQDQIGAASDRFFYLSNVNMTDAGLGATFGDQLNYNRPGVSISRYANDQITWEKADQLNLGVDMTLFKTIELVIDAYQNKRFNILQQRSFIPSTMGLQASSSANVGKQENKGIDASVSYSKNFGKSAWVQLRGNFTYATSKITAYDEPTYPDNLAYLYRNGNSGTQEFGYIAERLFTDDIEVANSPSQAYLSGQRKVMGGDIKYRDMNNDGVIDQNDKVPIGYPTFPEIVYGFQMMIGFGSFDFNTFFQGSARSSFFINPRAISPFAFGGGGSQNGLLKEIAKDHWSEDNRNAYAFWPRLSNTFVDNSGSDGNKSTWWMRSGDFLRLKSAEIGYTPKREFLNKVGLKSLRVYVNGSNLFVTSKFKLWDPEMGGNGLGYPLQRVYTLGLNVGL